MLINRLIQMACSRAAVVFTASVAPRASMLLMTILAARFMGSEQYGQFAILYATCINLTTLFGDGLAATANRYLPSLTASSRVETSRVTSGILSSTFSLALVLALLLCLFAPVLNRILNTQTDLTDAIRWSSLLVLLLLPNTVASAILHSVGATKPAARATLLSAFVTLIAGVAGGSAAGAVGLFAGVLFGNLVGSVCYGWALIQHCPGTRLQWQALRTFARSPMCAGFTLPTVCTMALGGPVFWVTLSMVSSSPGGLHEIAIFSAFYQWISLLVFIPSALNNFTIPWLASLSKEAAFGNKARLVIFCNLALACFIFVVVWLARIPIVSLYGADFQSATRVLVLLVASGVLLSFIAVMNQVAWASGRSWRNLTFTIIYSVLLVMMAYLFVSKHHMGAEGLALAVLVAATVQALLQFVYFLRTESARKTAV